MAISKEYHTPSLRDVCRLDLAGMACPQCNQYQGQMISFPKAKYQIIYADPPWEYDDKALAGKRGACCKYDVQDAKWISQLPVASIADKHCALFLWVTLPKLNVCFEVIEAWGFTYKTCAFVWVKRNRKNPSWFTGMGGWTRANAELCLFATKGKPKRINSHVHQIIDSPIQGHSRKPTIVREKIVQLLGDLPRIELFSRMKVAGWDTWGNQTGKSKLAPSFGFIGTK
jgi:N6-adenosine-specific RNA methylase IME4